MGDATIRRAQAADAAALTDVILAAYQPFHEAGLDLPPVADGIADDIRDHLVFVAEADGRIVAGLVLVPSGPALRIANLAVSPEASGGGLGRRLMALAEDTARAGGHATLALTTHAAMNRTRAFYRALGYQETGQDGNRVYMSKDAAS